VGKAGRRGRSSGKEKDEVLELNLKEVRRAYSTHNRGSSEGLVVQEETAWSRENVRIFPDKHDKVKGRNHRKHQRTAGREILAGKMGRISTSGQSIDINTEAGEWVFKGETEKV